MTNRILLISLTTLSLTGCELTDFQSKSVNLSNVEVEKKYHEQTECFNNYPFSADLNDCSSEHTSSRIEQEKTSIIAKNIEPALDKKEQVASASPLTVSESDLWQQIKYELKFDEPMNARIEAQQNWYVKHPDYMQRVSKRAEPFLYLIIEEIKKRDMPLDFALLPIVESAFDPFAYSHGRASGMWQFVPGTGARFGLKQTWWYDGRRDIIAATNGALDYLSYLHEMFDGDWLLAIAAYNSGEGRVAKAVKKNKSLKKPTDFWSLDLPKETRAYVPKLLALTNILRNADQLAFEWPKMTNQQTARIVDAGSQIDLAYAAELAGLTVEELHQLNPGYNRWATDPKGPHTFILPTENADQFEQQLAQSDSNERINWVRYTVKSGDSLLKLAKKYHTSVDVIQHMNKLSGNVIIAGDHLLIPVALKSLESYSLSADQRLKATQSQSHGQYKLEHIVQSGDTFWDLSRKYKVNLRNLAKWNGMAPTDPLRPGKKLVVWQNESNTSTSSAGVLRTVNYTVRRGDSLARIASRFKVKVADIEKWNQLNRKRYLQPGQKLKLLIDVTET